jgi:replication-associated recombination protein RarA
MSASYNKYEPKSFDEIILPTQRQKMFKDMIALDFVEPMLFYGAPGTGKSLTASLLSAAAYVIRCDREDSGAATIKKARNASTTCNLEFVDSKRLIVLDEIDQLHSKTQEKLRALLDETNGITSWVATTNHLKRVIEPLRSRMLKIDFNIDKNNLTMILKWRKWLEATYRADKGVEPEEAVLSNALRSFPDARQMILRLTTGYMQ